LTTDRSYGNGGFMAAGGGGGAFGSMTSFAGGVLTGFPGSGGFGGGGGGGSCDTYGYPCFAGGGGGGGFSGGNGGNTGYPRDWPYYYNYQTPGFGGYGYGLTYTPPVGGYNSYNTASYSGGANGWVTVTADPLGTYTY
jgi:hypothetical protein